MSRFRPSLQAGQTLAPPRSRSGTEEAGQEFLPPRATPMGAIGPGAVPPAARANFSGTGGLLVALMGLYITLHLIPGAQLVEVFTGVNSRIAVITYSVLALGVLLSGQVGRFFSLPIAKYWLALVAIEMAASVAGDYPGQSLPYIFQYGLRFHSFPILICAVAQTAPQLRRLLHWGAASGIVLTLITALTGQAVEGRLGIPDTDLSNPNDLALTLLIAGLFVATLTLSDLALVRLIPLAVLPLMVYYILQTGSRANFVTLVVLMLTSIYVAPKRTKIALLVLSPILAGALFFTVTPETRQRLLTIVSDPESRLMNAGASDMERSAIGSQYARTKLQERAIDLTLRHPLLGVGPLMFADAVDQMVREEEGQRSGWQFAHNVYLQLAAENGILAFVIFVGTMVWLLGVNFKTYRTSAKDPRHRAYGRHALLLLLVSVCFSVGIAFGNYIYDPIFPILVGLTAANLLAFRSALTATPVTPRPA